MDQQEPVEQQKTAQQKAEQIKKQGNEAFKNKKHHQAIQLYTQAISINGNQPSYYTNRAICYFNIGEYGKSRQDSLHSIGIKEDFAKGWRRKGLAEVELLMLEQAVQSFQKAYVIDSSNAGVQKQLIDVQNLEENWKKYHKFMGQKLFKQAIKCINFLSEKIKGNIELKIHKVECLVKVGETRDALTLFRTLSIANSHKNTYWYLKILIQLYGGDPNKAKKIAAQAKIYDQNGSIQTIIDCYTKAEMLKQQGNELLKQNNYNEAWQKYTQSIHTDPINKKLLSILYSNRAFISIKQQKYEQSLQDLNLSLEYNPKYVKSYARRADVFVELKRYEQAVADYKKIQEIDPSMDVNDKLNLAFKMSKKYEKKDYYKILGVQRNATQQEIRKAYKKQYMKYDKGELKHVKDKNKIFDRLAQAFSVLSDIQKKQLYDSGNMVYEKDSEYGQIDPEQIFQMFFKNKNDEGAGANPYGSFGFS